MPLIPIRADITTLIENAGYLYHTLDSQEEEKWATEYLKPKMEAFFKEKNICSNEEFLQALTEDRLDVITKLNYTNTHLHYALFHAIQFSHTTAIQQLLTMGLDLENTNLYDPVTDIVCHPLHLAIRSNDLLTIQLLLDNTSDPNIKDEHFHTALHWAAAFGSAHSTDMIIQAIVKKGGDIEIGDYQLQTPLHIAVEAYNLSAIEALVNLLGKKKQNNKEREIFLNKKDINGCTALDLIFHKKSVDELEFYHEYNQKIALLLIKAGANIKSALSPLDKLTQLRADILLTAVNLSISELNEQNTQLQENLTSSQ